MLYIFSVEYCCKLFHSRIGLQNAAERGLAFIIICSVQRINAYKISRIGRKA